MTEFRGHGQSKGTGTTKGAIPQKKLVKLLGVLIDTARARSASKTRDDARAALRWLETEANWHTPFVLRNIGLRRRRYLRTIGYPIEDIWLADVVEDLERLAKWNAARR